MADPWKIVSEKPIPAGAAVKAAPTPQESADADIAALQREIKAALGDTSMDPESRARRVSILEAELVRAINRQGDIAQAAEPPNPFDFDFSRFKDQQRAAKPAYGMHPSQDLLAGAAGAGVGAAAGAVPAVKTMALEGMRQAGEAFRGGAPATGVQNWTREMGYGQRGGTTYKQAHQFEQGTRPGAQIRSPATGETFKPEFKFQKPPIVGPSPLQQAGQMARTAISSPITRGGLGGLGVGAGGAETAERVREGDILGATLSGLSTAGSAASMFPPTAVPGAMTAGVSAGALTLADKIRNKLAQEAANPPVPEPTPEQLNRANRPALMYRPSIRRPQPSKADAISGALLDSLDEQLKQFSSAPG